MPKSIILASRGSSYQINLIDHNGHKEHEEKEKVWIMYGTEDTHVTKTTLLCVLRALCGECFSLPHTLTHTSLKWIPGIRIQYILAMLSSCFQETPCILNLTPPNTEPST